MIKKIDNKTSVEDKKEEVSLDAAFISGVEELIEQKKKTSFKDGMRNILHFYMLYDRAPLDEEVKQMFDNYFNKRK